MTTFFILAHHLEAHHVGIAALLFTVGSVAGWVGCARWRESNPGNQRLS